MEIPQLLRARNLAKALKVDVEKVLRTAGAIRRDKQIHWTDVHTNNRHVFSKIKTVAAFFRFTCPNHDFTCTFLFFFF